MSEEKNASAVEPQEEQAKKSKLREFLEFIAPIVIAMIIRKAEFVNLIFDAAIEIASPNNVPGIAAGS